MIVIGNEIHHDGLPIHMSRLTQSHVTLANQIVYRAIAMQHTEIYQDLPDPSTCMILKAIRTGVGWIWLVILTAMYKAVLQNGGTSFNIQRCTILMM